MGLRNDALSEKEYNKAKESSIRPKTEPVELNNTKWDFINKKRAAIYTTTSITLTEEAYRKIDSLCKKNNLKPNTLFNFLIENVYDKEKKCLTVDYKKKILEKTKTYSLRINEEYLKAFNKKSKELNMSNKELMSRIVNDFDAFD